MSLPPMAINCRWFVSMIIWTLIILGCDVITWYIYAQFSSEHKHTTLGRLYLSYCIIASLRSTQTLYRVYLGIKLYGKTISVNMWNLLELGNVLGLLNPYNFIHQARNIVCICIYYNSVKLMYYYDSFLTETVCFCIYVIGCLTPIGYAIIILAMICMRCDLCIFDRNECMKSNKLRNAILNHAGSYRVLASSSIGDTKCAICLESNEENEENNDEEKQKEKKWTALDCGHKYHVECIEEWFKFNTYCPYCRQQHYYVNTNGYQEIK